MAVWTDQHKHPFFMETKKRVYLVGRLQSYVELCAGVFAGVFGGRFAHDNRYAVRFMLKPDIGHDIALAFLAGYFALNMCVVHDPQVIPQRNHGSHRTVQGFVKLNRLA